MKNFDGRFKFHALRLTFGGRAGDVPLLQLLIWREHHVLSFVKFLVDFSCDVIPDRSIICKTFSTQVFRIIRKKLFVKSPSPVRIRVEKTSLNFNQQSVNQSDASGLSLSGVDIGHSERVNVMPHSQPLSYIGTSTVSVDNLGERKPTNVQGAKATNHKAKRNHRDPNIKEPEAW